MTAKAERAGPAVRRVRHGRRLARQHHRRPHAVRRRAKACKADWAAFTDDWRGLYQPAMEEVRSGRRAWTILDVLHRESLEKLLAKYDITGLSEADKDHINRVWHRLSPGPTPSRA